MEYILSSERFDELMTITKKSPGVFLNISQNSRKNTCDRVSFLVMPQACNFIKKETLTQVFSCEFSKVFKNNIFYKTPPVAASDFLPICATILDLSFCFLIIIIFGFSFSQGTENTQYYLLTVMFFNMAV